MRWKPYFLSIFSTVLPASALAAPATQPSTPDAMNQKIRDLETRIDQLESKQNASAAEDQATIRKLNADAESHSQLLSAGSFTSSYNPDVGFLLQSEDGNFAMHPSLLLQARYVADYRNRILPGQGGVTNKQGDDTQDGFELTRARISLDGNVLSPLFTYYFQIAQDASMKQATLLDVYAMYRIGTQSPLAIKVGQFKDPAWHEQNLLESHLMAVDRSLLSALVGGGELDRVQGAAIIYDQDRERGQIAVHDGNNGLNTPWYGPSGIGGGVVADAGMTPTNWGASGRGEYLLIGDRDPNFNPFYEYDQFSARGAKQNILVTGGGFDYSESGANKLVMHTVDAQFNSTTGWGLYGAYLGSYRNYYTNRGVKSGSYYDSGFLVQAAYLVTSKFEPFIRYDYTHLDGHADPGIIQDKANEITLGANYYLLGNQAKITLDGTWLPNGVPTDVNYLDFLQNNSHNEFVLRAQRQLSL